MPITLITGAPGNGKSLLLLWEVEKRRQKENRRVFYSGIRDLLLPWELFGQEIEGQDPWNTDPAGWNDLPVGSIIVIDEAQRLFRTRSIGSKVPDYVAGLETHRHKGYDIYLVTQAPALIDSHVRNLVETHKHLMRKFGTRWATIHEWKGVKMNCITSRKDSAESQFKYPKEVYTWYKSAEVHTVKFRVPGKVVVLLFLPFVLAIAAWYAWHNISKVGRPAPGAVGAPGAQRIVGAAGAAAPLTRRAYVEQFVPRIDGVLYSAPRYDQLTKPARAPVPVGCVLYAGDGRGSFCITQQGTRFEPPLEFIKNFTAKGGSFLDFDPDPTAKERKDALSSTGDSRGPQKAG